MSTETKTENKFTGTRTIKLSHEHIAAICHETNREYSRKLGDISHKPWVDAPHWQQTSAIAGVKFHLDNPKAPESASHEQWLEKKKKEGWTYGLVKNEDTKQHPCFLPFDKLPVEQQAKDKLFKAIVDALRHLA